MSLNMTNITEVFSLRDLNKKSVWRALRDDTLDDLLGQVPDELYEWVTDTADELQETFDSILAEATRWMEECGGFEGTQKDFALKVQATVPSVYRGLAFGLRAGRRDVDDSIWRILEPKGNDR